MVSSIKEDDRLSSVDNFAVWDRSIQAALGEDGRIEHVVKGVSDLEQDLIEDYPFSSPATPVEISKRRVALRKLGRDSAAAFSTTFNGLSNTRTVQNKLPKTLASFFEPQSKLLASSCRAPKAGK